MPTPKHYCGECCWKYGEQIDGLSFCIQKPVSYNIVYCSSRACRKFCSQEECEQHLEQMKLDLQELKRHELDNETTNALSFAIDFITQFSKL